MNTKIYELIQKNIMINPYSPKIPFKNFTNLDVDLLTHYDRLFDTTVDFEITPRYFYETGLKIGFRDIFYYIDQLYNTQPTSVVDVGCGECIWKKWFPNIIGFDPSINEFSQQDFVDYFDKDFSKGHAQHYDCGMALNSIHFIDWADIPNQIDLAMNIVKKQFLFTFNFNKLQNKPTVPLAELIILFSDILKSLNYEIALLDYPYLRGISERDLNNWSYVNGHVRFILSHKNKDFQ
jgi:SAM-dependent methyltransferase